MNSHSVCECSHITAEQFHFLVLLFGGPSRRSRLRGGILCSEPSSGHLQDCVERMAGQDKGSSSRSTTEDESKEESAEYGLMFKRFKKNKVEIASAITKLFPFLMSLRDHDFISEEKFQISRKKCENPDAVRNEVYDILCDLQKDFSLSLLEVIFSPTHLKAYPDLNETVKIFRDVSNNHRTLHSINGRHAEERPGLPKVVREEGSSSYERMLDGQEPQDDLSSSPLRPQAGAEQSTNDSKMCPCVLCSPARKPEDQEARMGSSQASTVETGNNTTVGKSQGKRNNSRARGQAAVKRRKTKKNPEGSAKTVRHRARRKLGEQNANFSAALLPVTCGDAKGVLHKDKFKRGITVKSIQSEDGDWHTPPEFEILGGLGRSKNWKLSLRCYNRPLKFLIQRNFLPHSPRTYGKRKKDSRRRCGPDKRCVLLPQDLD